MPDSDSKQPINGGSTRAVARALSEYEKSEGSNPHLANLAREMIDCVKQVQSGVHDLIQILADFRRDVRDQIADLRSETQVLGAAASDARNAAEHSEAQVVAIVDRLRQNGAIAIPPDRESEPEVPHPKTDRAPFDAGLMDDGPEEDA